MSFLKFLFFALLIAALLSGVNAGVKSDTAASQQYRIGVKFFVDIPTSTKTPAPTLTPAPTQTPKPAAPAAWNCLDYKNVVSGMKRPVVCADPNASAFTVRVTNGFIDLKNSVGAAILPGGFTESPLKVARVGKPDDCMRTFGCMYTVSIPRGTFGDLAMGRALELYPYAPELGKQGVKIWLKITFQPGKHNVWIIP